MGYFIPQSHYTSVKESEWGSTAKAAFQVPIRNNLYRALLRLRRCGRNARPVALWVDYFCINQADLKEKTKQLPRMVDIYSRASNVCVWLGEGDNDGRSDEAMQFISKIVDFAALDRHSQDPRQARKWYALSELMRDRWFSRRWVVQEIALAKRATVHCGGSMVQWPDFSDAVSLLISNQETIASLFDDLSEWREGRKTMGDVATYGASILLEATNNLFRRKPEGDIKKPAKTIEYLTTSLKTFDTGDPRDLIYSLVSIASDTAGDFWSARSGSSARNRGLAVDYRKSQAVVYKDFTKFCVETSNSLDIICRPWAMPLTDRSSGFLPSWIPLLRNSEFGAPGEANRGRKNGESLVGPAGDPHYQASGQHVCRVKFKLRVDLDLSHSQQDTAVPDNVRKRDWIFDHADNQDVLQATGIRLAQITAVSPRSTGGIIHRESLMMGGWEGFRSDTDSVPDRIWRTLVADRDQNGDLPPSWYRRACFRCLEIADTFNNGDLNVGELLTEKSEMLRKYLSRVRNVTWNRRFFTTELPVSDLFQKGTRKNTEGQYMSGASTATSPESKAETGDDDIKRSAEDSTIRSLPEAKGKGKCVGERPLKPHQKLFGICPSNTRRVDIVCILFGCSVPVILRPKPSSEYFILVGEAYVHGKMDGEEVEDRDSDCENDGADAVDFQIL
ncbi:hypothetical protein CNYM01_12081 [Colletotrichum nymphaeae SA-01]|uniref:Heterokaryon incompatibility domain-containing protein n=1 Tax=Colletotrichum nymphaeae SA-01 TaxID=1460502 RepID=A0A135SJW6_9PEZI|nr:hypothetical protein CNYM01_12081 [Colletotrichum nymphaeae SA-01]